MSILKQKSDENFAAISILVDKKLFGPVVHCAYYSSLQLVIHYFYEFCGLSEEEASNEMNKIAEGSHMYYLKKLVDEIRTVNPNYAAKFYKFFNQFKRLRTEADYKLIEIKEEDIVLAQEKAIKIKSFLISTCDEGKCKNIYNI